VLLPNLRNSADASVIFVSSSVVQHPRAYWGAYGVSKTGLEAIRSMLVQELEGDKNIRINSINPGRMRTPIARRRLPRGGSEHRTQPCVGREFVSATPERAGT